MEPRSLEVTGAHGLRLHLLEWSREGVALLLLHGFGNEAHIWDDLAPALAPHYRVLALDLRGHGDSGWDPERRYDYEDHVADLEALVEALGIERLVLVGHSLGGRVAMLYAGGHPERMAGLVVVDSAPELDARGTLRISLDAAERRDPSFSSPAEYETLLASAYPAATPAALRRMARHGLRVRDDGRYVLRMDPAMRSGAASRASAEERSAREDRLSGLLWDALEKIACPTLVVRGAASDVVSADVADRMVEEALAQGRLAVVPRAGHSVMTDNPRGLEEAVCGFVLGEG
jgi:pimeloyl-ACP methyl ester carboxylesterase